MLLCWKRAERASEGKPEKGHDNHQVISQVCGMSWNMEPQALRDQYDEWAKVERNNHKKAFPDYKFAPAKAKNKKPGTSGSNRRDERDSDDDNASILDSYEFSEFPGHPKGGPPSRTASRSQRYMDHPDGDYILPGYSPPSGYSRSVYNSPSPALQPSGLPAGTAYAAHVQQQLQHHPSSFQYSNPGKPRPADYGASLGHEQYYQQRSEYAQQAYPHPHSQMHGYGGHPYMQHSIPAFVENVFVNKANSPAASSSFHGSPVLDHHQAYSDLMGTPAYGHAQLSRPRSQIHQSIEPQIDPSLMSTPPGAGVVPHEEAYDALGLLGDFGADGLQPYSLEPGMAGGVEGGSHSASPHPQQFEQAYHTPNGNDVSTPAEGDDKSATKENSPFAVPDIADADCDLPSKLDNPSSDWETSLGGSADFGLEDIDQFLGTTQDSPVGA
ncbi:hypothetical protein F5Y18DRAFT_406943 [Xylariaceae sp. FL1019]|nr:hypothetical protein F5Y18DRAFT_406943 [Xylariaceae sp. FL1019]